MDKNCNIIKDLLPLYVENLLSEESEELVKNHLENCNDCKKELESIKSNVNIPTPCDKSEKIKAFLLAMKKFKKLIFTIVYGWILFGTMVITGFDTLDLILNIAWMFPFGAVGYVLFRKSAFYRVPLVISISYFGYAFLGNMIPIYDKPLSMLTEILFYIILFSVSAFLGIIVAALVGLIIKKIPKQTLFKRIISIILILFLILASVYSFFLFIGNPFTGISSLINSIEYLDERFEGSDYYPYKIRHDSWFEGFYIVYVKSLSNKDINFQIKYNYNGKFHSCDYDKKYKSDAQTILSLKYARAIDTALIKSSFSYEIVYTNPYYYFPYNSSNSDQWASALTMENFNTKDKYDLLNLGKTNGVILIEVYSKSTSINEAKKVYLELKNVLDELGIGFRMLAVNLISTENDSKASFSSICYEDITNQKIDDEIQKLNKYQERN